MKYASADIPACPGAIKAEHEDFIVDEVPAYDFSGAGDHTLVRVEKRGITTFEAVRRLCRSLNFKERDVGYAGLKDSRGVTRQWLSFEHLDPAHLEGLDIPKLRVLDVTRHGNKLKRGHLRGNRFVVRLRDVAPGHVANARATLDLLARRGVPNWYDDQRFGRRGDNAVCGLAILRGDWPAYFAALLGGPESETDPATKAARQAYAESGPAAALELWPHRDNLERTALKAVAEYGPDERALKRIPQKLKLLQVSAVQSLLFNRVLEARFEDYDRVWAGDICRKENGADFLAEDPAAEQPRADDFEISPTGPIFGHRMIEPRGRASELEGAVLSEAGLTPASFEVGRGLSQKGDRRSLRFPLREASVEYNDSVLELAFALPKGCYATVVLKEITKG